MNGLPYYKAYPRDFIEGTVGMPFELKGAYRLVLDLIYMHGGKLPDDARYISGVIGCNPWKWQSLRKQLIAVGKLHEHDGVLTNSRADIELESTGEYREKQRVNRLGKTREIAHPTNKNKDLQEPPLNHTDTDTDTDTEKKEHIRAVATATRPGRDEVFEEFWQAYPKRDGANPKQPARKKFTAAVKSGADPSAITDGAKRYRSEVQSRGQEGTPYVAQAVTWLNQQRWSDYAPAPPKRDGPVTPLWDSRKAFAELDKEPCSIND